MIIQLSNIEYHMELFIFTYLKKKKKQILKTRIKSIATKTVICAE